MSHRCLRAHSAHVRIPSTVGSPGMVVDTQSSWSITKCARSGFDPVTTRARLPNCSAMAGTCERVPSPKTIRPAVANSNGIALPAGIGRIDVLIQRAGARLGEHVADLFDPSLVMCGQLVCGNGMMVAIDLHQQKLRGVIGLLEKVEARHTGLLAAVGGVFDGGFTKRVNVLGLDQDADDQNVHRVYYDPKDPKSLPRKPGSLV